jgi:MFS family permease
MSANIADAGPNYPRRWAIYAFILLFLLYVFDYIDRYVIVSLYPFLKTDFGLSDAQCGLLMSGLVWTQVIFTLPVGVLLDRWSRKKSIGIMSILWGIGSMAGAITTGFTQLFATRCVVGVGEAGYGAGGTSMLSGIFRPAVRARILGFWQAAIPVGQAIGILLGGVIAMKYGWRSALGIVAIPGIIVAVLMFWVKDYKNIGLMKSSSGDAAVTTRKMNLLDSLKELFRSKSLIMLNIGFPLYMFGSAALSTWMPSYFNRFGGMDPAQASTRSSIIMAMAVIGAPLGGFLTDFWVKKNVSARMLFPAIASVVTAFLIWAAFALQVGTVQFIVLLLVGICSIMFLPGLMAVTQDVVHPGLRSTSRSVNIFIQSLLGTALGPLIIGAISDAYGLDKAMWFISPFILVAGILFFVGATFYKKDLEECEKCQITFEGA